MRWWERRWGPWALVATAFLLAIPLAFVLYLAAPKPGDFGYNCGGIGFGETPCGWDAVGFVYAIIGIPFAGAVLALMGLLELTGPRGQWVRLGVAALAIVVPWLGGVLALLSD